MSEIRVEFPWTIDGDEDLLVSKTYLFATELGEASILFALFSDGTNLVALIAPNGAARFARVAPQTNWALEERRTDAEMPPEILAAVDKEWRYIIDLMAEEIRRERERRGSTAPTPESHPAPGSTAASSRPGDPATLPPLAPDPASPHRSNRTSTRPGGRSRGPRLLRAARSGARSLLGIVRGWRT